MKYKDKFIRLQKALTDIIDATPAHDNWCSYPDGPCGGMGGECISQRNYKKAINAARQLLEEISEKYNE